MELLIPGLILVALMAYLSTRIKRTAAAAFRAETIETDEFSIEKPEGFLNVVDSKRFLVEMYSRDFGAIADKTRLATANVTVTSGSIQDTVDLIDDEIASDVSEVVAERHYRVIEAKRTADDNEFRVFYKLAENDGRVYRFEIQILAEADKIFLRKAEAMLASFELK